MKLREDLARMIVHDMRSPLTGIIGYTRLLRDSVDGAEAREMLEEIDTQAQRLNAFANDLLMMARMEEGRLRANRQPDQAALGGLISNAIKFTPPGGHVTVRANRVDREVVLSVKDTGIGIPQPHLESIFQPFTQVSGGIARPSPGSGVKLALCRGLAELHGGRIAVHSEPGQGSRFDVFLPA
ncbi:MAG: sensor histidine kinase [Candidatus Xenobia bacterium]